MLMVGGSSVVTEDDRAWMRRALAEAERGRGAVEPNPMVGAVVVRAGSVVGVGHHERFGGPHAEVHALNCAGELARGATLYVSLEPCCHHGKTPPCVDAIRRAGIARVVAAHRDPFPRVAGGGFTRLREAGVTVVAEVEGDAARHLNAPYLKRVVQGLPFVTAKWAMTLDGRTATALGDSRWISNPRSRAAVHEARGQMDAIIVGIGTALADDPELTARPPGPRVPLRVVLDARARLPIPSRLVQSARAVPVLIATTDRAPSDRIAELVNAGCRVVCFPAEASGTVAIIPVLAELARQEATHALVEGGGAVLGSFLDAAAVDALDVFVAPKLEGGAHKFSPIRGCGVPLMAAARLLESPTISILDGDVRIQGRLEHGPWARAVAACRPEPNLDDRQSGAL